MIFIYLSNQILSPFQPSPRRSDQLLKNLHLDLDALGGGLLYEVARIKRVFKNEQSC